MSSSAGHHTEIISWKSHGDVITLTSSDGHLTVTSSAGHDELNDSDHGWSVSGDYRPNSDGGSVTGANYEDRDEVNAS